VDIISSRSAVYKHRLYGLIETLIQLNNKYFTTAIVIELNWQNEWFSDITAAIYTVATVASAVIKSVNSIDFW